MIKLNLKLFLQDPKSNTGLNAILGQLGISPKDFNDIFTKQFGNKPNWLANITLFVHRDRKFNLYLKNICFYFVLFQFLEWSGYLSKDSVIGKPLYINFSDFLILKQFLVAIDNDYKTEDSEAPVLVSRTGTSILLSRLLSIKIYVKL